MTDARLITIPISHFCEKARWALDATGMKYREEAHAPVAHLRATRAVGGKTVPVFVHGDTVLRDSTEIVLHAEAHAASGRRLVPEDDEARARVLAIEHELDETLGIDARLLAYWFMLSDPSLARAFVGRMARVRSPLLQRVIAPLFRGLVFRGYKVSRETADRAEKRVRATFVRLGEDLGERGYLVGDRFTLADLTLSALAAPLLGPPQHPVTGRLNVPPAPGLAALRAELAETVVGKHVLRMYREHRAEVARA